MSGLIPYIVRADALRRSSGLRAMLAAVLAVVIIMFQCSTGWCASQGGQPRMVLKAGFTAGMFTDVDQRDAQVAMQLWTREMVRGMGLDAEPRPVIYPSAEALLEAVKRGELTVVSLTALDYLQIRSAAPMTPAIVASSNIGKKRQYVLLTRRDSGLRTVRDLRGKSLLLPSRKRSNAGHIWLEVLLLREGIRDSAAFFRQTQEVSSLSQAIMGVFFKKVDAAIITRGALETSAALNPQIGRQLYAIAESRSMLGDLTCIPHNVNASLKRLIEQSALRFHETPSGRQAFTLFQMDRAIPYEPAYLEGLEELLRERGRLMAQRSRRK